MAEAKHKLVQLLPSAPYGKAPGWEDGKAQPSLLEIDNKVAAPAARNFSWTALELRLAAITHPGMSGETGTTGQGSALFRLLGSPWDEKGFPGTVHGA